MLRACFSTLVYTPFRQLLILFKSFSALIRSFFRQYYDYFPRFARYNFVLSSPVLFLPYSHTQTSRHLSHTTLTYFQTTLAKAQLTYTKKVQVSSPPTGCQFKKLLHPNFHVSNKFISSLLQLTRFLHIKGSRLPYNFSGPTYVLYHNTTVCP